MTKKRSRVAIILEVLELLEREGGEVLATRLATAAGLAYDRMINLLEDLEKRGVLYVETSGRNKLIKLSPKGYHLLNSLRSLRDLIRDLGIDIE